MVPGEYVTIDRPDILIFEGINVLQPRELPKDGKIVPFVSDFFDFSIYIDADEKLIHNWYIERFMRLRETAFRDPQVLLPSLCGSCPKMRRWRSPKACGPTST